MASLRQGLVERGAWQLEGFSGASQALGVSRIDVALGGIPLSTWMQYFIASGSSSNLDFSVQTTCKQLQASWKEMETRLHSCLEALVDQYRLECTLLPPPKLCMHSLPTAARTAVNHA